MFKKVSGNIGVGAILQVGTGAKGFSLTGQNSTANIFAGRNLVEHCNDFGTRFSAEGIHGGAIQGNQRYVANDFKSQGFISHVYSS